MSHRSVAGLLLAALAALAVLAATLAGPAPQADAVGKPRHQAVSFRIASFNVLGSNHTVHSKVWLGGKARAKLARRWLEDQRVSVAGLQEGQVDQLRTLTHTGRWESFPDPRSSSDSQTAQSVAWRRGAWELVRAHTFTVPFDRGQLRQQPVVQLQHRRTDRRIWVISVHLTAGGGKVGAKERRVGIHRLVKEVSELRRTKDTVLVTGDMNSHADFYCPFAAKTDLHAAAGGSYSQGDGCVPPSPMHVDWLWGSPAVQWSDSRFADGGVLDTITDHTVPVSRVLLPGR
jgi:hypothetical protein